MRNTLKQGTSEERQGSATMDKRLKPCPFCGCPAELYIIPKEEKKYDEGFDEPKPRVKKRPTLQAMDDDEDIPF